LVRRRFGGIPLNGGGNQMIVTVDEANNYFAKGWEYVAKVSRGKVIIKMNHVAT
jgi:hypothetical protein